MLTASPPVTNNDTFSIIHDRALVATTAQSGVLVNDTDPDGDTLTSVLVSGPQHGTLSLNSDGTFIYTPNAHYVGSDSFVYKDYDGALYSSTNATVTLNVTNTAPGAHDSSLSIGHDRTLSGIVSASDTENDVLAASVVSNVTHGNLSLNSNGTFVYTPTPGYSGSDSFTYNVSDGVASSGTATVNLSVLETAPTSGNDYYMTGSGQALTVAAAQGVLSFDSDDQADTLTPSVVSNVTHGTLSLNANGSFTYTPNSGFTGLDSFTYKDSDGLLTSNTSTAYIYVGTQSILSAVGGYALSSVVEGVATASNTSVGQFDDGDVNLSNLTAEIRWGDGTESVGSVSTKKSSLTYINATAHTYVVAGTYSVSAVILGDSNAGSPLLILSNLTTQTVTDHALTGTALTFSAFTNEATSLEVATFTDADPNAKFDNYTATINWGNGTTTSGTVVLDPAGGKFDVYGIAPYTAAGTKSVAVTVTDNGGSTASITSTANITANPFSVSAANPSGAAGTPISGTVATFTDTKPGASASTLQATISWGDGTTSVGTIAAGTSAGTYVVSASHSYSLGGSYPVSVQVSDTTGAVGAETGTATVSGAGLTVTATSVSATETQSFNGSVATFVCPDPITSYSATISWGDGTTTAGTITAGTPSGHFIVSGTHAYATYGTYATIIQVFSHGPTATVSGTATVVAVAPSASGTTLATVEGQSFSGTIASFTSPDALANFSATITWGDGSTSAGTVATGSPAGTFTVTGMHTYATPGSYAPSILISDSAGASSTATSSATISLKAPDGLAASVVSPTDINVSWIGHSSFATGYTIQELISGNWVVVGTVGATATTFAAPGPFLGSTTYNFRVQAMGSGGLTSAFSAATAVTTPTVPPVPSGLTASASSTTVSLSWSDVSGETGFIVQRSPDGTSGWTQIATPGAGVTSYHDTGLTENKAYYYRIQSKNAWGSSANSTVVSTTTGLSAPDGLAASIVGAGIALTWVNHSSIATGYSIEETTTSSGFWQIVGSVGATSTGFTVPSFFNGSTTYQFRVRATGTGSLHSDYTAVVNVTTPATPGTPSLTSALVQSDSSIALTWTDVTGETGYLVQRMPQSTGVWATIATLGSGITSYTDTGLSEASYYNYRIVAINQVVASPSSNASSVATQPKAPTNFTATVISGGEIDLAWTANSSAAQYYYIDESTDDTNWHQVDYLVGTGTNSAVLSGPFDGSTSYHFRIHDNALYGGSSTYASTTVTTQAFPGRPALNSTTTISDSSITLTWNDVPGETGFLVERATSNSGPWTVVATLGSGLTSYTDVGLREATSYWYEVIASNAAGQSAPSSPLGGATLPSSPQGLTATVISGAEIDLSWAFDPGLIYDVEESTDNGASWQFLGFAQQGSGTVTYQVQGSFQGGTKYLFQLLAYSAAPGYSTAQVSVTTPAFPNQPNLTSTTTQSSSSISLAWNDVSGETGFLVQRYSNGIWTTISTLDVGATSYTDTGLSENASYSYRVIATNASGYSAPSNSRAASTRPSAPTGLSATVISGNEIDLTWTDHSNQAGTYEIDQSVDGVTWTSVAYVYGVTAQTAVVKGPFNGASTYDFRVFASAYPGGNSSSATTSVITPAFPNAPTQVVATAQSDKAIIFSWNNVAGATGFVVQRATSNNGPWTTLSTLNASVTAYTDSGLPEATSYWYQVIATNSSGSSAPSAPISSATQPSAPTGLTASVASNNEIDLSWTNYSTAAYGYNVDQSLDGTTWVRVTTVYGVNTHTATINGPFNGSTDYHFRVSAAAYTGGSSVPVTATVTTPAFPNQPTITSIAPQANNTIIVTWNDAANEAGFILQRSILTNSSWTTIATPATGVTSYTDSGLVEGVTVWYRVIATNSLGQSVPSNSVSFVPLPKAPTGLTATVVSSGQINLSWTDHSSLANYDQIDESTDGVNWHTVANIVAQEGDPKAASAVITDTFSGSTTYYFRVRGTTYFGDPSFPATTSVNTPIFPGRPTITSVVAQSNAAVALTWNDVANETGFTIQRASSSNGPWTTIGTNAAGVLSFTDTGLQEATPYWYQVIAINAASSSVPSNSASVTTLPAAPKNATTHFVSATEIDLTWVGGSTVAPYVVIDKSYDSVTWQQIAYVNEGANTYGQSLSYAVNDTYQGSTTYYFRLRDVTTGGVISASALATITTPAFPAPPTLTSTTGQSDTSAKITWTDVTGETGYIIQRRDPSTGEWATVGTTTANVVSYTDTGLHESQTYWYRVSATNAAGTSAPSSTLSAVTLPAAPTGLTATVVSGGEIDLAWTNHSATAVYYEVDESTDGSNWHQVAYLSGTSTQSTIVSGTFAGSTAYQFRVFGYAYAGGYSTYATTVITTPAFPPQPTLTSVIPQSSSSISVSWNDVSGETGYLVERSSSSSNGPWSTVGTLGAGTTSYLDTGLSEVTSYWYKVIATNGAGQSAPSNSMWTTTQPSAPTGLSASVISGSQINLSWTNTSYDAYYQVIEQSDDGTNWYQIASLTNSTHGVISDTITGTYNGSSTYHFRVHVYALYVGYSAYSTLAVTTPAFPNQPTLTSATAVSDTSVALTWNDDANETSYTQGQRTLTY